MQNTKVQVSAGGKVNWNAKCLQENKPRKQSKLSTIEHSTLITWKITPPKAGQKWIKDQQNTSH